MHKQYLLQFVGFQTRTFAICDRRSRGKQALTGTLEDATLRYSSASIRWACCCWMTERSSTWECHQHSHDEVYQNIATRLTWHFHADWQDGSLILTPIPSLTLCSWDIWRDYVSVFLRFCSIFSVKKTQDVIDPAKNSRLWCGYDCDDHRFSQ